MTDKREEVLARLHAVVASIPQLRQCGRNVPEIDDTQLPAGFVYDADEEVINADDTSARPSNKPSRVTMAPEIVLVQHAKEAGSDLTTLRVELIRRVLFDEDLNAIVETGRLGNGAIRYIGCQTDFGWGRSLQGGLRAQFAFTYVLRPDDL